MKETITCDQLVMKIDYREPNVTEEKGNKIDIQP